MLELERTVMNRQLQIAPQFSSDLTALSEPSLPRFRLLDAASWGHHKIPRSQRQGGDVSLDLQKKIDTSGTRTRHDKDVHVPGPGQRAIVLLALLSFLTLEDSNEDLPKKRASSHCVNHTQR